MSKIFFPFLYTNLRFHVKKNGFVNMKFPQLNKKTNHIEHFCIFGYKTNDRIITLNLYCVYSLLRNIVLDILP